MGGESSGSLIGVVTVAVSEQVFKVEVSNDELQLSDDALHVRIEYLVVCISSREQANHVASHDIASLLIVLEELCLSL